MTEIPPTVARLINSALADGCACLVGTISPDGFPQISPKGSVLVHDSKTLAFWERSWRTAIANLRQNPKVVIFYRNPKAADVLPPGASVRFYGTATVYEDGPVRDEIMAKVVKPELDRDPERRGAAVVVRVERVLDLAGNPVQEKKA